MSEKVQQAYETNKTLAPAATAPSLPKLIVDPGTKTLFFGDSWTAGRAANPQTEGFAYKTGQALNLNFTVDANGSGTGYQNVGPTNAGTYNTRLSAYPVDPELRLLVLQGGLNDPGAGNSLAGFVDAVNATLATAKAKFPNAQIVLMGPISPTLPAGPDIMTVTASLRGIAEANGLRFVSGVQEKWLTPENLDQMIDASKARHPSTAGHAHLAQRLTEDLKSFAG